jgi:cardiolipin synthase
VKLAQLFYASNQLTLLRMVFLPLIVLCLVAGEHRWALALFILAGLSDFLDGLLARTLHQQTMLGQYLDPVADKLLLSTMFLVLAVLHEIPWKFTIVVFSRDISILGVSAVLYATTALRDFRPSIFGKANTTTQVAAIFFVLLRQVHDAEWVEYGRLVGLWGTFCFTILSGVHYVFLVGPRLRRAQGT